MDTNTQTNTPQLNPEAAAIAKAIAYTESGGPKGINNPSAGQSGETKSIFQFMPDTWSMYAKQVLGNDKAPMTPENESVVVYQKVNNWLSQGYNTEQIASMWNAGEQRPDAYKQGFKGTNSKGASFDTPAYAKKVADYAKQFSKGSGIGSSPMQSAHNTTQPANQSISGQSAAPTPQSGTTAGIIKPPTIKELHQQGSMKQPGLAQMKS